MSEPWKTDLKKGVVDFMEDIISQVPENGGARGMFVMCLNEIARPTNEVQRKLDKLAALERNGVDNWEGYDDAMSELEGIDDEDFE